MHIVVLLSSYNGEKYIQEQLDSLYDQTQKVDVLVRDDGSTDSTCKILEQNAKAGKLNWYSGDNLRPAKSFWDLVKNAPQADYYAFCDQDDIWFNDKIEKAVNILQKVAKQDQPLLYCSAVDVVDENLNPLKIKFNHHPGCAYLDFAHSLIYSLAPGCTMVFNDLARNEFVKYDMDKEFPIIHDWLAHKIVAMLGQIVYDFSPSIYYRQHSNNVIGAHKRSRIKRVINLMRSSECVRSNSASSLLHIYNEQLDDEKKILLNLVANYKNNCKYKKQLKKDKRFYTTRAEYIVFRILVVLNKI